MHDSTRPIPPAPRRLTFDPFDPTPEGLSEPMFTFDESLAALDERQHEARVSIRDLMRNDTCGSGRVSVNVGSWSVTHGQGNG